MLFDVVLFSLTASVSFLEPEDGEDIANSHY